MYVHVRAHFRINEKPKAKKNPEMVLGWSLLLLNHFQKLPLRKKKPKYLVSFANYKKLSYYLPIYPYPSFPNLNKFWHKSTNINQIKFRKKWILWGFLLPYEYLLTVDLAKIFKAYSAHQFKAWIGRQKQKMPMPSLI